MSFENFPYTNFHELNLDWIIQKVKAAYSPDNPPENIVISVNGETGEVVLYKDAIVRLPDVEEETWNIHRVADNSSSGIEFDVGSCAKRIDGTFRYPIYDAGNPPPYPVRSVNGQTGNVVITIPVTSVNGQTGAVTLYQNAAISFPDVSDTTWNMYRGSGPEGESKITGIQFRKDNAAQRINGTDRYNIYDEENPPPYPVTSVGTLTGAVAILDTTIVVDGNTQKLKITFPVTTVDGHSGEVETWGYTSDRDAVLPIEAEANAWGLKREVPSGLLGIDFEYDSDNNVYEGYITFKADGSSTTQRIKILTPDDIPSSSGVVSVNGLNGVVVLTAADITIGNGDSTTTANAIAAALADFGDTWSDQNNYLQGAYVIYNKTLYKATAANSAGTWASQSWAATTVADELAARDAAIAAANTDITNVGNMIAGEYNPSTVYYKGAFCKKDGVFYKSTAQTTGTWDSSKWTATKVGQQIADRVMEDVITPTPEYTLYASENYSIGDYILIQGKLYRAIASISDGDLFDSTNVTACTVGEELTALSDHIVTLDSLKKVVYSQKTITISGEGQSATAEFTLSDFTVPTGYAVYGNSMTYSVYGSWEVVPSASKATFTGGTAHFTSSNTLKIAVTSGPSGGAVNFSVVVMLVIYKS